MVLHFVDYNTSLLFLQKPGRNFDLFFSFFVLAGGEFQIYHQTKTLCWYDLGQPVTKGYLTGFNF
uniref:Uncharacterized protein n=1 Tax=Rhizophora mucronata TaxID=61149 RepID=A0A2P2Q6V6_RHIMU